MTGPDPFPGDVEDLGEPETIGRCDAAVHLVDDLEMDDPSIADLVAEIEHWITCDRAAGHFGMHVAKIPARAMACYDQLGDVVEPLIVWADSDEPQRSAAMAPERPPADWGWDAG